MTIGTDDSFISQEIRVVFTNADVSLEHVNTKEGHCATNDDFARELGVIHDVNAEDWGGCDGYKHGLYTRYLASVTCPKCLRGLVKHLYNNHEKLVYNPIKEFLASIGVNGEFCSTSEIKRLCRIAFKHRDEWWEDVYARNPGYHNAIVDEKE